MTTFTALGQAMADHLAREGIPAFYVWPKQAKAVTKEPVVAVHVSEIAAEAAGFQNYLGEEYNAAGRTWTETYGQKAAVKFLLDLYSPLSVGEEGCRVLLDQVALALQKGGPAGLRIEKWSMTEPGFEEKSGLFRGKVQAACRCLLVQRQGETGSFEGFEVKGGVTV